MKTSFDSLEETNNICFGSLSGKNAFQIKGDIGSTPIRNK